MSGDVHFRRLAIIGMGLLGSSLARVVRKLGLADHIAAAARSQATIDTVQRLGLADSITTDVAQAAAGADLVMICTPLGVYAEISNAISPVLEAGAIVSDVGSVKRTAFTDILPHLPAGVHLVPGHPVAGTEHSGPEAGFAELFEGRWCVLTPAEDADAEAVETVAALWRRAGMSVEIMDAAHHDQVLALTSHLPHLIAYTIVGAATDLEERLQREVAKYSAGGFREFTRIAASDPVMWRDVFLANSEAVLEILGRFNEDLTALQRAIRRGQGDVLEETFARTRAIHQGIIDAKQD